MRKITSYLLLCSLIGSFTACKTSPSTDSLFPEPSNDPTALLYSSLDLEPVPLDSINTSYSGDLHINRNKLQWVDYRFCWIFEFTPDGHLLQCHLGQGKSNKEIPVGQIDSYAPDEHGGFTALSSQTDCYVFDSSCTLQKQFLIQDYVIGEDPNESRPDKAGTYTYAYDKLITRASDNRLYINIYSESDNFNFFGDATPYFEQAHILMGVNLENQKADRLLGRYSPTYAQHNNQHKLHLYTGFDIAANGDFYIALEADSLIYQYDKDYRPIRSFGYAGRDMDTDYIPLHNLEDIQQHYQQERETGHYDWIEYIDQTDRLFRSYAKGPEAETYGLQIYDGSTLIADIDVPRQFRVKGYIAPYYYAIGQIDEENGQIPVYRFKLDR